MNYLVPTKKSREDAAEIKYVKKSVLKRIETIDKLSSYVEEKLNDLDVLGSPLVLDPGTEGYQDTLELFIKLIKANKDLVESYRKLKITEFDIRDKEHKISTMNFVLESIEGKTPEQIREQVKKGKFAPVNMALASLFGEAVSGDANASRSILQGMADWGSNENFDSVIPELKIKLNLPEEERQKMIDSGDNIQEIINITPEKENE